MLRAFIISFSLIWYFYCEYRQNTSMTISNFFISSLQTDGMHWMQLLVDSNFPKDLISKLQEKGHSVSFLRTPFIYHSIIHTLFLLLTPK